MKKILCLFLLISISFPLFASSFVIDRASLLTEDEKNTLEKRAIDVKDETGISTILVTDNSAQGLESREYAEKVFTTGDYGKDGVVLFLNMGDREYYILTTGEASYILDDYCLSDSSLDPVLLEYLSSGDWYKGFYNFLRYVEREAIYFEKEEYVSSNEEYVETERVESGRPFDWSMSLFFSLLIGFAVSFIFISREKKKLKSIKSCFRADDSAISSSFKLRESDNILLYSHVSRVMKTPPPPKGGVGGGKGFSFRGSSPGGRGGKF